MRKASYSSFRKTSRMTMHAKNQDDQPKFGNEEIREQVS
jgi:hypothetical protein